MAELGRDLSAELFGTGPAPAASADQWRQTLKLDDLERQYQLPSGLMTSVLRQESGGDPRVKSSAGAQGLFQFMPKTAAAYKIDPFDPQQAAPAAAKELSTLYKKYGGDVDRTLAAWNWGQGNVDRQGFANRPAETRGFIANVKRFLSPASAEAATPTSGRDLTQELFGTTASTGGRDLSQELLPLSTPTQTPPAPTTQPGASQGPLAPRLSMGDPTEAASEPEARATIEAMRARQAPQTPAMRRAAGIEPVQEGGVSRALESRTPDNPMVGIDGKPLGTIPEPGTLLPSQQPAVLPSQVEAPLEEGMTAPSTMIPLLMPGAGLKLVPGALKTAAPFLNRAVRPVAEGLSQTAGWTAGRTAETGEVPSPAEIGKEAALNVAVGGVVEIPSALRAAKNAALRSTPGAQILLNQRAVQEAERLGKRVFNAEDKAVVGKAFDSVAATGEKLDVTPVRDLWNSLTLAERRIAGTELNKISSTFADALKTRKLGDWDIGELQHLRSELRTASLSKRTPETQDLLQSLRASVDEAIANGMAKGSLPAAELIEAQKAYRKVMQAEDLQGLITKHTRDSPNLKWQELNLAALNKELRGGGTKAARNLTKGMDATEKQLLMQELDSLKRHYPFVQIPRQGATMAGTSAALAATGLALTGNLPAAAAVAVPAILAAAARSPNVMSLFKRSIIEGKGRLAQHHVDALLNAIRHEND